MRISRLLLVGLFLYVTWRVFGPDGEPVEAADIVEGEDVVFFSAEWCGYCDQARDYLESEQVEFHEIDIEATIEGQEQFREVGGRGVPLIFIRGERIDGWSRRAYAEAVSP